MDLSLLLATPTAAFILTILVWWLSTGVLIMLCAAPGRRLDVGIGAATLVLAISIYGITQSADDTSPTGAYVAFLSALGIWGWIEMMFLMGLVTGPRTLPCPDGISGGERFALAVQALLYHELLIVAGAVAILALTWDAPNLTGLFAFLILLAMRISAKLNIFLGVPNLTDEFLPKRLGYLKSYFRKGGASVFFPISVGASSLVAIGLISSAVNATGGAAIGLALLAALIALAILEHVFMVVPIMDSVLWRWALPASASKNDDQRA